MSDIFSAIFLSINFWFQWWPLFCVLVISQVFISYKASRKAGYLIPIVMFAGFSIFIASLYLANFDDQALSSLVFVVLGAVIPSMFMISLHRLIATIRLINSQKVDKH